MYFGLIAFGLVVGLIGLLIGLVILILFLLNLMRLLEAVQPQNRTMSPGLVWLNLIPVFSIGWMIYTVIKIKDSVGHENAWRHSSRWGSPVDERNTHTIGLVYAILAAAGFVLSFGGYANRGFSAVGGLISIAVLVCWIWYWVRTSRLKRDLQMTAGGAGYGATGPYGPGSQYGAGGPYPPAGTGYGTGYGAGGQYPPAGAGYGQTGSGYSPSYNPNPTWPAAAAPAAAQPPAPAAPAPAPAPAPAEQTPPPPPAAQAPAPAGESQNGESGRNCSQCGTELNPGDQFCAACGTPAPKE